MNTLKKIELAFAFALIFARGNIYAQESLMDPTIQAIPGAVNRDWRPSLVPDRAYEEMRLKDGRGAPVAWQPIREADLMWKKRVWREISVLEKQNHAFTYAGDEHTGGGMFIEILIDAINSGKVVAYSSDDDRFTALLTKEQLREQIFPKKDSTYVIDVDGTETLRIVEHDFDPLSIAKYRIKEDWLFDRNTGQMVSRIIGIAPVVDVYDDQHQYRGSKVMFWLHYPDIRGLLASYEAVNPDNDMQRTTWDDLFESRLFGSRITKVSDPYGKSFAEKEMSPMEALYEGKRAADKLFNKEHDVWHY